MDRVCTFGIALALILPAGLLSGQETPTLAPGTRVRVSVPKARLLRLAHGASTRQKRH